KGRLDGGDARRKTVGAVRAYGGGHVERRAGADLASGRGKDAGQHQTCGLNKEKRPPTGKAFHFWLFSEPFTLAVRGSFPLRQAQGSFAPHHEVKGGSARSNPHPEVRAKRALKDEGAWISQSGLFPVARGERAQAQRIELDEACGVLLVVSALIVLEGDELVGIERLFRF